MQVFEIPVDESRKETTGHGTPAFPVAVYHSALSLNALGYTSWHWHEELQFCIVTQGQLRFVVGETDYILNTGDGIFINRGFLHCAKLVDDPLASYICLNFGQVLLFGFLNSVFFTKYIKPYQGDFSLDIVPLYQDADWQSAILSCIPKILELHEAPGFGYEFTICQLLWEMWLGLLSHHSVLSAGSARHKMTHNQTVQQIISFIERHFQDSITLEMIAREISFSPAESCRIFKRFTGETIFSFLKNYRLAQAIRLLQEEGSQVNQVAFDTGFCSTSYFIKVFRKSFGTTPQQYIKSMQLS